MNFPEERHIVTTWRMQVCVALLLLTKHAYGLDPNKAITQYGHTAWRVQEGHLPGEALAITQTTDGYLWIGTQSGLFRFDGVQFVPWKPPEGTSLSDPRIYGLLGSRDGSLWIGTARGLAQWKDKRLKIYATEGRFGSIIEDHLGAVWAGHTRRSSLPGLCRVDGSGFRCFGPNDGLPISIVSSLYEDAKGNLWVGGLQGDVEGLCQWKPGAAPAYHLNSPSVAKGLNVLGGDSEGTIWASSSTGLERLVSGKWRHYPEADGRRAISGLLDRDRGFWIGTANSGIVRRFGGRIERLTQADGLSSDSVNSLFEDREGNVWAATSGGLDRFRDLRIATLTQREGLSSDDVHSVTASRDGSVWIAEDGGLDRVSNGTIAAYGADHNLRGKQLTSLLEDSQGRLWVGVENGLLLREHDQFVPINMPDHSAIGMVVAMAEDRDHDIWISTPSPNHPLIRVQNDHVAEVVSPNKLGMFPNAEQVWAIEPDSKGGVWLSVGVGWTNWRLLLYRNGSFRSYSAADGLGGGRIPVLFSDAGQLWAGTDEGLSHFRNARFGTLATRNGLSCDGIEAVIKADDGAFWLKASCGLVRIAGNQLEAWSNHPQGRVQDRLFDVFDGVRAGVSPFRPRSAKSADGRLWFVTEGSLEVVDPRHVNNNPVLPPVHVDALKIDGKIMAPADGISLAPRTHSVEIDYTALSLSIPERVFFRYKLEGAETDWQDAGNRRQAFYNDLPPKSYRFRVIASNNDGLWNEAGAVWSFSIAPAFYQTNWFRILCALASALLMWLLYQFRIRQMTTRIKLRFEERLAERTRIARDLHDTLLQSLAGVSLQLDGISKQVASAPRAAVSQLKSVREQVDSCFREARLKVWDLRSPDLEERGLSATLGEFIERITPTTHAGCHMTVSGQPSPCSLEIEEELLRIVQEAVNNAIRHAQANEIQVALAYEEKWLRIRVSDDGRGFDFEQDSRKSGHWGLRNMQERAAQIGAECKVTTAGGRGTEIEVSVRLPSRHTRSPYVRRASSSPVSR